MAVGRIGPLGRVEVDWWCIAYGVGAVGHRRRRPCTCSLNVKNQ